MLTERTMAWRQLALSLAALSVFFLLPSLLPMGWPRNLGFFLIIFVWVGGVVALSRYWRR